MFSVFEGSCRASEPLGLQPAKSHKNPQRRRSSGLGRARGRHGGSGTPISTSGGQGTPENQMPSAGRAAQAAMYDLRGAEGVKGDF